MDTYAKWIRETEKEIQEAVQEAENGGWHHMEGDTLEARTYLRLLTWAAAVAFRREVLDGRR